MKTQNAESVSCEARGLKYPGSSSPPSHKTPPPAFSLHNSSVGLPGVERW